MAFAFQKTLQLRTPPQSSPKWRKKPIPKTKIKMAEDKLLSQFSKYIFDLFQLISLIFNTLLKFLHFNFCSDLAFFMFFFVFFSCHPELVSGYIYIFTFKKNSIKNPTSILPKVRKKLTPKTKIKMAEDKLLSQFSK